MGYVDKHLEEEIILKMNKIERTPQYYDTRKNLVIEDIRSLGDIYSFWIENPELRKDLLLENRQPKTLRKMAMSGIQNVHNGWYFLSQKGKYGNFVKELNPEILKRLNGIILGNKRNDFRQNYVTLNCLKYTPPSPEKIQGKIENAILRIKNLYRENPLESAITAHLEISAIQPFSEGNKRTARLIQDRILCDTGFPPAIIPAGEGRYYMGLLCKTLPFYDDKNINGQRDFYDYCASKVNNGLDEVLGDLVLESKHV